MKRVVLWLCLAGAVAPAGAALTVEQAQRLALERSRQLQAHDAAGLSAREMARSAGELPDPVLRMGVDNVPAEGGDKFSLTRDSMTMRRIGLMQELTRTEKREARRDRFEREADKALAERAASAVTILRDTALAWLERWHVEAMVTAAGEFSRAAATEVEAADAAYRSGRGAQAEAIAARSMHAMAEDRRAELERRRRTARIELARWTGRDPAEPLGSPPDMASVPIDDTRVQEHVEAHPEVRVLEREMEVALAESRVAGTERRPDWTWEATWQQRGSAYSNMFSIGVSVPLPWDRANRQDREVAARLARAEEVRARRDELVRAHVAEISGWLEEWRSGRERQRRFREEILPLARERTQAVMAAYAGGKAALAEAVAARRMEHEATLQSLALDLEVARAWARLTFLLPPEQ